jgi:Flp pilus assembly pilin Flp
MGRRHERKGFNMDLRFIGCTGLLMYERMCSVRSLLRDESGQGTTEYAILVGVLVVMAILSIVAFRGRVQELWDAIASGIGSL